MKNAPTAPMTPAMRNAVREFSWPAPLVWVAEGAGEVLLALAEDAG